MRYHSEADDSDSLELNHRGDIEFLTPKTYQAFVGLFPKSKGKIEPLLLVATIYVKHRTA